MKLPKVLSLSLILIAVNCLLAIVTGQVTENKTSVAVGMVGKVDQILIPGGELEAVATTDPLAKIVVRVADTFRHGDAFRYNLEFTGLEPGRYDLTKSLKRKNPEESATNIAPIEVEVTSSLPPGKLEPSKPNMLAIPEWMRYWTKLDILVVIWIIGLALLWGKAKATGQASVKVEITKPTIGDTLKPLVKAACDGTIEPHQRAELESLLINYWTTRLTLADDTAPGQILSILKNHPEAGPLILRLETWLHKPPGEARESTTDLAELLRPYESIIEPSGQVARSGKGQA